MKLYVTRFLLALATVAAFMSFAEGLAFAAEVEAPAKPVGPKMYTIGPGDVLEINVWKEPEASVASVVVRPDGMISLPLIKEVRAAGHTPISLQAEITERLAKLIRDADVTVVVKDTKSEKAYVIGAVKKEGAVVISTQMTVLEAIAEVGGLTDYDRISTRRSIGGKLT